MVNQQESRYKVHLIFIGALVVLAAFLYSPGIGNFFYNDDFNLLYASKYRTVGDILSGTYPGGHFEKGASPYWRPGWHLAFKFMFSTAGLHPALYMLAGIFLHLILVLLLYALLVRTGTRSFAAALACGLFLSSPAYLEAVFWPSASLNVLPSALLLFLAVWAIMDLAAQVGGRRFAAGFFLFVLSLTFKEAAYTLPVLVVAAFLFLDMDPKLTRRIIRGLGFAMPFLAVVILHYAFLNRFSIGGFSFQETFSMTLHLSAEYFRSILHIPAGDTLLLGILAAAFIVLLAVSPRTSRFFLVWAALSLFPFAVRAYASRFSYFCHLPLALYVGSILGHLATGNRSRSRLLTGCTALVLSMAAVINMCSIPREIDVYRTEGEKCRAILEWCDKNGVAREDRIYVDTIVPALANGFSEMIDLFLDKRIIVENLNLMSIRNFLVIGNPSLDHLPPETVILRFVPAKPESNGHRTYPSYRKTTKADLLKGRRVLPIFGFRYAYEVVEPEVALERIKSGLIDLNKMVLLDRPPSLAILDTEPSDNRILNVHGISINKVTLDVSCDRPCLFLICLPAKLDTRKGNVLLNGKKVKPFRANGIFNALELPKGKHRIEASFL